MSDLKPCDRCGDILGGFYPENDGFPWLCDKCKGTEPTKAYRVTLTVDEDAMAFLEKAAGYSEGDELFVFDKIEEIVEWRIIPCAECGSRYQMENEACSPDSEYCCDCCECPEHFPELFKDENE